MSLYHCTWAFHTHNTTQRTLYCVRFSIIQERRRKACNLHFSSEPFALRLNSYEGQSSKPPPPLMLPTVGKLLPLPLQSRCKIRWLNHPMYYTLTQHLSSILAIGCNPTTPYNIILLKIYLECHTTRIFTQPTLSIISKYAFRTSDAPQPLSPT